MAFFSFFHFMLTKWRKMKVSIWILFFLFLQTTKAMLYNIWSMKWWQGKHFRYARLHLTFNFPKSKWSNKKYIYISIHSWSIRENLWLLKFVSDWFGVFPDEWRKMKVFNFIARHLDIILNAEIYQINESNMNTKLMLRL